MKKIFLTTIIIFSAAISMAQVKFNFAILNAQPPAQLSEWSTGVKYLHSSQQDRV